MWQLSLLVCGWFVQHRVSERPLGIRFNSARRIVHVQHAPQTGGVREGDVLIGIGGRAVSSWSMRKISWRLGEVSLPVYLQFHREDFNSIANWTEPCSFPCPAHQRFWIHLDTPEQVHRQALKCYRDLNGLDIADDERKERAQNTADERLHTILLNHPCRAKTPSKASWFFIPIYSSIIGFLEITGQRDIRALSGAHPNRMQLRCEEGGALARLKLLQLYLNTSSWFQRRGGLDHVWAVTSPSFPETLSYLLPSLALQLAKTTILTHDPEFFQKRSTVLNASASFSQQTINRSQSQHHLNVWKAHQDHGQMVVIPYVSHLSIPTKPAVAGSRKHIDFFFRGNLHLEACKLRAGEYDLQSLPACRIRQKNGLVMEIGF